MVGLHLHVLDSTEQGRGRMIGGGIPCFCSATRAAPVWAWRGAVVGAALLLFSQQLGPLLSYCHICHMCVCVKDCGAEVQVPVYTEEEEVAALQDRFLM